MDNHEAKATPKHDEARLGVNERDEQKEDRASTHTFESKKYHEKRGVHLHKLTVFICMYRWSPVWIGLMR